MQPNWKCGEGKRCITTAAPVSSQLVSMPKMRSPLIFPPFSPPPPLLKPQARISNPKHPLSLTLLAYPNPPPTPFRLEFTEFTSHLREDINLTSVVIPLDHEVHADCKSSLPIPKGRTIATATVTMAIPQLYQFVVFSLLNLLRLSCFELESFHSLIHSQNKHLAG